KFPTIQINVNTTLDNFPFSLTCHQWFAADGRVIEEPAKDPLTTYEAKIEGDLVLVKGKGQGVAGERSPNRPQVQQNRDKNDDDGESEEGDKTHKKDD
ncbi:hypothetical protein QUB70_32295, partial [Microcoleus sp. A003_D6]